jgi:hypothetical protein
MYPIYDPTTLPAIDELRLFVLGAKINTPTTTTTDTVFDVGWQFAIHAEKAIQDAETLQQVAASWRQLPPADPARCHTPPYGVSFYQQGTWLLSASICWHCNNIFLKLPDGRSGYDFESQSAPAQRLLQLLRSLSAE